MIWLTSTSCTQRRITHSLHSGIWDCPFNYTTLFLWELDQLCLLLSFLRLSSWHLKRSSYVIVSTYSKVHFSFFRMVIIHSKITPIIFCVIILSRVVINFDTKDIQSARKSREFIFELARGMAFFWSCSYRERALYFKRKLDFSIRN